MININISTYREREEYFGPCEHIGYEIIIKRYTIRVMELIR